MRNLLGLWYSLLPNRCCVKIGGIVNIKNEKEILEYCRKNTKFTTKYLVDTFGNNSIDTRYFLRNNNIKYNKSNNSKAYVSDFNFFETIDTEEKAYWLGFILADGYLNNQGVVGIELSIEDEMHLHKFKNSIKSEAPVKIYNKNSTFGKQTNCRFQITNETLYFSLLDLGITRNKTNDGKIPNVDSNLLRHLVRGYFDGNGCIVIKELKKSDGYRCTGISFCGTKEILKYIEELSGFSWTWSKRRNNDTNNYQIGVGRVEDLKNFLNYMYEDSTVYLDRKYEKYLKVK